MRLFVYLPERKTSVTLWLPEDSTVAFAKQCIIQSNRSTIAVSNDSFRLVCRGKEMKNEEKVGDHSKEGGGQRSVYACLKTVKLVTIDIESTNPAVNTTVSTVPRVVSVQLALPVDPDDQYVVRVPPYILH